MRGDSLQVVDVTRTPWDNVLKSNWSANNLGRVKLAAPVLRYLSFLPKKMKYPIEMSNDMVGGFLTIYIDYW